MNETRKKEIETAVRAAILGAIGDALDGGEDLMKEVWEYCADEAEFAVVDAELRRIEAAIEEMG